jgi:hypothetical protein
LDIVEGTRDDFGEFTPSLNDLNIGKFIKITINATTTDTNRTVFARPSICVVSNK